MSAVDLDDLLGGPPPRDDLDRVLGLAHDGGVAPSPERVVAWSTHLRLRADAPDLRPAQVAFLDALSRAARSDGPWGARGAVALLGCGHGKTLCAQLAPCVVGWPARRVLVIPAALRPQLRHDVATWAPYYPLGFVDEHGDIARPPSFDPWSQAGHGGRWVSYEQLSGPGSANLLDDLAPELLVLDEAHLLGNPDSARWRRVARYVARHPSCRVVVLSGTLSARGLAEMAHLCHAALRDWSPLPSDGTLPHLAACVDVGGEPSRDDEGVAARVVGWAARHAPAGVEAPWTATAKDAARWAVWRRIESAAGVAVAAGVAADVSLRIRVWAGPRQPAAVVAALGRLRDEWVLPDGTELVDALEHHRHARTLALGWYQRWVPGSVDPDWLAARRRWAGEVRRLLLYDAAAGAAALDSPALVARAAADGRLDARASAAWEAWAVTSRPVATWLGSAVLGALPFARWPEPPSEVVWLDGGRAYLGGVVWGPWGASDPAWPFVVWVGSPTAGVEAAAALHVPYSGAGSRPPPDPAGPSGRANGAHPLAVASHHVHGRGWNGDAWSRALVVEPPDGPAAWEQLLARHHRPGARRDVEVVVLASTPEARTALVAARTAARYARDTLGQPQRLLLADWTWDDGTLPAGGPDPWQGR